MGSCSILNSTLNIRIGLDDAPHLNAQFVQQRQVLSQLANNLLVYETVVIPTIDFGILRALASWMKPDGLREAITSGAIRFVRKKMIGYAGGGGVNEFVIHATSRPFQPWQQAIFGPTDDAIQINATHCHVRSQRDFRKFLNAVYDASVELEYPDNEFFIKHVAKETYQDIIDSPILSAFVVRAYAQPAGAIDLERLPGIASNQMRILRNEMSDACDLILRTAELNRELIASYQIGGADLLTTADASDVLNAKLYRDGIQASLPLGFARLIELNGTPDVGGAVADGRVSWHAYWRVRQGRNAKAFRQWLRACPDDESRDVERAYVQTLKRCPGVDSTTGKTIQFLATQLVGKIEPTAGVMVSAANTFFVSKWLSGYSPRLFLNELDRLVPEK